MCVCVFCVYVYVCVFVSGRVWGQGENCTDSCLLFGTIRVQRVDEISLNSECTEEFIPESSISECRAEWVIVGMVRSLWGNEGW